MRHTQASKNKISQSKIGAVVEVTLPSDSMPYLYGKLLQKSDGKFVTGQKITRRCSGCGFEQILGLDSLLRTKYPHLCKKCTALVPDYRQALSCSVIKAQSELPQKTLAKMRRGPVSLQHRKRISCAQQGIPESEWSGFRSATAKVFSKEFNAKWSWWRDQVYRRDQFTCQFPDCPCCHNKTGSVKLAPHHIVPRQFNELLTFDVNNGITLCEQVHQRYINKREFDYYAVFKNIVMSRHDIRAVLFDLDGVLVNMCICHRDAFLASVEALTGTVIPVKYHDKHLNGLPTSEKLEILCQERRLAHDVDRQYIENDKQRRTKNSIKQCLERDPQKIEIFEYLQQSEILTAVVTNSIQETTFIMLDTIGCLRYPDVIITNTDTRFRKPHPEPYIRTMISLGVYPNQCLVVEDSPKGREAAKASGAHTWFVTGPQDVTLKALKERLKECEH